MRLFLALAVLAVCGVAFVFHERKSSLEHRLGGVATELGGRQVRVHCQSFGGALIDVGAEAGTVQFDAAGHPADVTDLERDICGALARYRHDVGSSAYGCVLQATACPQRIFEDVLAVHTLAHETWHLQGVSSESQTECYALQTTARAASLLGADARSAQATAAYALARLYPQLPDDYRRADCRNGGPLDLRPADPVWP